MYISEVTLEVAEKATAGQTLADAVGRLLLQLDSLSRGEFSHDQLVAFVAQPNVFLWFARHAEQGEVLGMITLATFRTPGGLHARIEDLVVDEGARGNRFGEALLRVALDRAAELGAGHVDLTSRPSREAARRLYERAGFVKRDTAVFRFSFGGAPSGLQG